MKKILLLVLIACAYADTQNNAGGVANSTYVPGTAGIASGTQDPFGLKNAERNVIPPMPWKNTHKDPILRQVEAQCGQREIGPCMAEKLSDGSVTCEYDTKQRTYMVIYNNYVIHGSFDTRNGHVTSAKGEIQGFIYPDIGILCSKPAGWGQETIPDYACADKAAAAVEAEAEKLDSIWRNAVIPEWCINFETE